MKIAYICDYYYPFEVSGAEVSSRLLAESYSRTDTTDTEVIVITPNYGSSPKEEIFNGVKIFRFPFVLRQKVHSLPAKWVDNPVWFFYTAWRIYGLLRHVNPDIIHVQNKNLLTGSYLSNLLLRKPLVTTVRDYRLLCDLGICLLEGRLNVCSWREYFLTDIPRYISQYKNGRLSSYPYAYLVGFCQLLLRALNRVTLNSAQRVVCVSCGQEKIYKNAGIKKTQTIYNPVRVSLRRVTPDKNILFVGRYTPGKGKDILDKIIPEFCFKHRDWTFTLVTKIKPHFDKIDNLKIYDYLPYNELRRLMANSYLTLVPSKFPEPLSRASLDSLSEGTPVVASRRGGMKEIVVSGRYGYTVNYSLSCFLEAIEKVIKNQKRFRENIYRDRLKLQKKFYSDPVQKYLELYESLI